jgi:hypothetical protein
MSLGLDTTTALRGTGALRRLVGAIVNASSHDEADWIEWKSTLDLNTRVGHFHIVHTILGLANRLPERATLTCEGVGYLVVGAEPGATAGITTVDLAALDQVIEPYVGGSDGPRWTPTYVSLDGPTVLVVTVEPPRQGDRIFTLRKEFVRPQSDGKVKIYPSGTVFVRKHGRTVVADAADFDALQARLLTSPASSADLEVSVVGDVPLSWFDAEVASDMIEKRAAARRAHLVAKAEAEERRRFPEPTRTSRGLPDLSAVLISQQQAAFQQMAAGLKGLGGLLGKEDTRTLGEYIAEVDDWSKRLAAAEKRALPGRYFAAGRGAVAVRVHNRSQRFLPDVEVEVLFTSDRATGFEEKPEREHLPEPPWTYGERRQPPGLLGPVPPVPPLSFFRPPATAGPRRRISVEEGSVRLRFRVGDLRPEATETSDRVFLLLAEYPEGGAFRGHWKATVRDLDAVLTGAVEVPVTREPVDIRGLLEAEADED